jgi:hypothetical protein
MERDGRGRAIMSQKCLWFRYDSVEAWAWVCMCVRARGDLTGGMDGQGVGGGYISPGKGWPEQQNFFELELFCTARDGCENVECLCKGR